MDIWEELEIEPTKDEKEVKRAYASRLKKINREQNPEEFQNLRYAYESAIQYTKEEYDNQEEFSETFGSDESGETLDYPVEGVEEVKREDEDLNLQSTLNDLLNILSLTNENLSDNRKRAFEISRNFFFTLKEKGELEAIKIWESLEKELFEESIEFSEDINLAFREEIGNLYDGLEEKNPKDFPLNLLEKLFVFFDWTSAEFRHYYAISILQRRINARKARQELEKEIKKEKRLSPILKEYDPKEIKKDKENFTIYLIQKKIGQLETTSPEIFEFELDENTVEFWKTAKPTSGGLWKYIGLLFLLITGVGSFSSSKFSHKLFGVVLTTLIGIPVLIGFFHKFLFFYQRLVLNTNLKYLTHNLWVAIFFLVFSEVLAVSSLEELNFEKSFLSFFLIVHFVFFVFPFLESISNLLFQFFNFLKNYLSPFRPEIWYVGYLVLFVASVFLNLYKMDSIFLVLVFLGFYTCLGFEDKTSESFFLEVYTILTLAPTAGYLLFTLFGFKDFTLVCSSIAFMITFSSLRDVTNQYKFTFPPFLLAFLIGFAILFCFVPIPFPVIELIFRVCLFLILFLAYFTFTKNTSSMYVWFFLAGLGMITSTLFQSFWIGSRNIFPVFCQLTVISLWMVVNKVYIQYKRKV